MSDFAATPQQALALVMREAQSRGIDWFNPIHAGGMTGSFMQETGDFRTDVINFERRGDQGTAHGLMQWRGDRYRNLLEFARRKGVPPTDLQLQISFAFEEANPNSPYADYGSVRAFREMQGARSAQDAAIAFIHAERPAGYDGNARNAHDAMARVNHALRALGEGNADISQFGASDSSSQGMTQSQRMIEAVRRSGIGPDAIIADQRFFDSVPEGADIGYATAQARANSYLRQPRSISDISNILVDQENFNFGISPQSNLRPNETPVRPRARPTDFGITSIDGSTNSFGGLDFSNFGQIQSPPTSTTGNNQLTFGSEFDNVQSQSNSNFDLDFGLGR